MIQDAAGGGKETAISRRDVRDALAHLHDFVYLGSHPLAQLLGPGGAATATVGRSVQRRLLEAIAALQPSPDLASGSDDWRRHQLLRLRYVQGLGSPAVQRKLAVSRATYYRDHERAIEAVAALLLERASEWADEGRGREQDPSRARGAELGRAGAPARAGRLRMPLTSFVGRDDDLARVTALLRTVRLLTLTGAGGVGKSRLALHVADAIADYYPAGVALVELAPVTDPVLVPQAVASALGLVEQSRAPLLESLTVFLSARRLLLVLDNCEHLLDACAQLADALLPACPELRMLATSREPLRVPGETVWRVPSLAIPNACELIGLVDASGSPAVRLFADRAEAALPGFALNERTARAVVEICRRLDGIPLTIELAAARVRVLSVEQIAERLDDRFRLLTGDSRAALPRHRTLRAAVDWSHDLLTGPDRVLLRRLAVFAGRFTVEAAEAVCGDEAPGEVDHPLPRDAVLDALMRLVDKSLVVFDPDATPASRRSAFAPANAKRLPGYRMLETIRQYAAEKLDAGGETDVAADRHQCWYATLADEARRGLDGPDQLDWAARLDFDHDNLRAAMDWGARSGADLERVSHGLRIVGILIEFWRMRGTMRETWRRAEDLLARAELTAGDDGQRFTAERAARYAEARAWALRTAGYCAAFLGDHAAGMALAAQGPALARQSGAAECLVAALIEVGYQVAADGDYDAGKRVVEEGLALARRAKLAARVPEGVFLVGLNAKDRADLTEAKARFDECLALWRAQGNRYRSAWPLLRLGEIERLAGRLDAAVPLLEEALAIWEEFGDRLRCAWVLENLFEVALAQDDLTAAQSLLQRSLLLRRDMRAADERWLEYAAGLARVKGDVGRALRLWGAASALREAIGAPRAPAEVDVADREIARLRRFLGDAADRTWAEGRAMAPEEAVADAMGLLA